MGKMAKTFLLLEAVKACTGYSTTTIYDRIRAKAFPPIKIGRRASAWDADEVAAWQAARLAERDGKAA